VRIRGLIAISCTLLGLSAGATGRDIALISNKANRVQAMTLPDIARICKGQLSHWPDGTVASCITRDPSTPEMKLVLTRVYGMTEDEVKATINSANHGRSDRPVVILLNSDEAVVKKVETTPGAVGLVDVYSITGGVIVMRVGGKLPLEPGYPLHGN